MVGVHLHHVLVAQIDRHQSDRSVQPAHHRLQGHRQHAGLGWQQATGTGAATLGEELHRVTLGKQQVEVFTKYRAVERVALEGAANEEGAAVAENRARRPEVEVDARRDMGRHHPLVIDDVGEQQVVHVAAVAGDVDDLVPFLCQLAYLLGAVDGEPAVELVPQPAEETLAETDQPIGEVGGDLVHIAVSPLLGFLEADPFALGLLFNRLLDHFGVEQLFEQQVAVRQFRASGCELLAAEVGASYPRQFVGDPFVGAMFVRHIAQGERRREAHQILATLEDHDERLLQPVRRQTADDVPAGSLFAFPTRGAAPEQGDGHHLDIEFGILLVQIQQLVELLQEGERFAAFAKQGRRTIQTDIARQQLAVKFQRGEGAGQTEILAALLQGHQVSDRTGLQGVDDGSGRIQIEFCDGIFRQALVIDQAADRPLQDGSGNLLS